MAEPAEQASGSVPYGALRATHAEYCPHLWERLELLTEGGFRILQHAKEFLPRLPNESDTFYQYRLNNASYINHLGPVIGYLAGMLFGAPLTVARAQMVENPDKAKPPKDDFWAEFSKDCDLAQSQFSHFMERVVRDALRDRRAIISLDMPVAPVEGVNSRADEDQLGLGRVWLDTVPLCEVIDWKYNESAEDRIPGRRKFEWLKLRREIVDRSNPLALDDTFREQFVVWTMGYSGTGFVAQFAVFETAPRKKDDPTPVDADLIPLVRSGVTSFRELPFIELDLGAELWLGNKAGPLAEEHYRDRSSLKSDMMKSLNEIPFVKKGPEINGVNQALPAQVQQDPNRGNNPRARYNANGWAEIGSGDELGFAGPSGVAHSLCKEMLADLREEIHRAASAMSLSLANNATTVGRSGESKAQDKDATNQVLRAIATLVHRCALMVYGCAAAARNERISWTSSGLDSFDREDRPALVQEAPIVTGLSIPSETFLVEYFCQIAQKILGGDPEVLAKVREEIKAGVRQNLAETAQRDAIMLQGLQQKVEGDGDTEDDGGDDSAQDNQQGE